MINKASLDLIKDFEGFRAGAYRDPVGIWTIGFGTTAAADVGIAPRAGMVITEAQAEGYLNAAVAKFARQIAPKITRPINENQLGAFVSLAYNIGPGAFARSSALDKFNDGDIQGAADAILLWNKAGGKVLNGLVRRRAAERALFSKPTDLIAPKASPETCETSVSHIGKPSLTPVPPKSPVASIIAAFAAIFAVIWAYLSK